MLACSANMAEHAPRSPPPAHTYPPRAMPVRPSDIPHGAPHRSTSAATYPSPRHACAPAPRPPPLLLLDHLTEALVAEGFGSDDAAGTATPMADDDVAGAAGHCARTAGCGSSDDHRQQDVIMLRRTRSGRAFPPPISVISRGGRPWLSLRAHREGGRLVLREMRLPSQELLQPCKEDGRFKLLIHPEAGGRAAAVAPQERQGKDKSALDHLTR